MHPDRSASSQFLRRLERRLAGLRAADRAQIVAEVRGHIEEQRARLGDDESAAIAALGSADVLGQALLQARSPSLVLRLAASSMAVAHKFARGARVSLICALYLLALAFMAMAVAKLIMPTQVGLWTAPHQFTLGIVSAPGAPSTERLGFWLMPLAMLLAIAMTGAGIAVAKAGKWLLPHGHLRAC